MSTEQPGYNREINGVYSEVQWQFVKYVCVSLFTVVKRKKKHFAHPACVYLSGLNHEDFNTLKHLFSVFVHSVNSQ